MTKSTLHTTHLLMQNNETTTSLHCRVVLACTSGRAEGLVMVLSMHIVYAKLSGAQVLTRANILTNIFHYFHPIYLCRSNKVGFCGNISTLQFTSAKVGRLWSELTAHVYVQLMRLYVRRHSSVWMVTILAKMCKVTHKIDSLLDYLVCSTTL